MTGARVAAMSVVRPGGDHRAEASVRAYRPHTLLRLSLRVLVVWVVLAVALLVGGRALLSALLPVFGAFIDLMQPDFVPSLEIAPDAQGWVLRLRPLVAKAIGVGPGVVIPAGTRLDWFSTSVDHTLVPILLFLTALLSWPATSTREWGLRLLAALPALIWVLLLSAPILLIGRVQMWVTGLAVRNGAAFQEPALVTFMIFMESGGRWLVPLGAAAACIALGQRIRRSALATQA
jgi:hypothetical protein